jgi:hypothetical protein
MKMSPADLMRFAPEAFPSAERQRIARAFQQAWLAIAPEVGKDRAKTASTQIWLAETIIELADQHETAEALANAAIFKAVREALR